MVVIDFSYFDHHHTLDSLYDRRSYLQSGQSIRTFYYAAAQSHSAFAVVSGQQLFCLLRRAIHGKATDTYYHTIERMPQNDHSGQSHMGLIHVLIHLTHHRPKFCQLALIFSIFRTKFHKTREQGVPLSTNTIKFVLNNTLGLLRSETNNYGCLLVTLSRTSSFRTT